ncbi:MAG: hypothetical protein M3R61_06070, partial [Chloroflexota bacterium]|nr:hypothetical protein [Chloroflexota bacterium]
METKILSGIGAGSSQRRRANLIGAIGRLWFYLLLASAFVVGPVPAQIARAADIAVSCGDSAGLINAIQSANAAAGADTITLPAGCIYPLTGVNNSVDGANGLPDITTDITIEGNGATITRDSEAPSF